MGTFPTLAERGAMSTQIRRSLWTGASLSARYWQATLECAATPGRFEPLEQHFPISIVHFPFVIGSFRPSKLPRSGQSRNGYSPTEFAFRMRCEFDRWIVERNTARPCAISTVFRSRKSWRWLFLWKRTTPAYSTISADGLKDSYPVSAEMFRRMRTEENTHRHRLIELYRSKFGEHIPHIRRDDVKGFYQTPAALAGPSAGPGNGAPAGGNHGGGNQSIFTKLAARAGPPTRACGNCWAISPRRKAAT